MAVEHARAGGSRHGEGWHMQCHRYTVVQLCSALPSMQRSRSQGGREGEEGKKMSALLVCPGRGVRCLPACVLGKAEDAEGGA